VSWGPVARCFEERLRLERPVLAVTHGPLRTPGTNVWPAGPAELRLPCMVAMVNAVQAGKPLILDEEHPPMDCGAWYAGLSDAIPDRCEAYVVDVERYVSDIPTFRASLPAVTAPRQRGPIVFRVLADLEDDESPDLALFQVDPDQLSVLHTLVNYATADGDRVIAPWGAACSSIYALAMKEQRGAGRAVLGTFDPSQRIKGHVRGMSLAVPQGLFLAMVANIDRSLLMTSAVERLLGGR
jgi:hypothetical protein